MVAYNFRIRSTFLLHSFVSSLRDFISAIHSATRVASLTGLVLVCGVLCLCPIGTRYIANLLILYAYIFYKWDIPATRVPGLGKIRGRNKLSAGVHYSICFRESTA